MIEKMVITLFSAVILVFSLFLCLGVLRDTGIIDSVFSDKAHEIRAEAELKRVNVELLREQAEHKERLILIEKATKPRTPLSVHFLIGFLCVGCIVLFIRLIKEKERRRFAEYREKIIRGGNPRRKKLPESEPGRPALLPGRFSIDERDREREGV